MIMLNSVGQYLALSYRSLLLMVLLLPLAGCSEALLNPFGANQEKLLPGKRLAILSDRARLQVDRNIASINYRPPTPLMPNTWTQSYGNSQRNLGNIRGTGSLAGQWQEVWRREIGRGQTQNTPLQSSPVAAGNRVFVMDTDYLVSALNITDGNVIWQKRITSSIPYTNSIGGGLSLGQGKVLVTTGYGNVIALDVNTGEEIWRQELRVPIRAEATVMENLAIVQTLDSQAFAFDLRDGQEIWYNAGIAEITAVMNQTAASGKDSTVYLAFNSGEVNAVNIRDGTLLWSELLSSILRMSETSRINTISASPVVLDDRLLITSYSDQIVMLNANTGQQLWQKRIGAVTVPWVAGKAIFLQGNDNRLYALDINSGGIRWIENPNQLLALALERENALLDQRDGSQAVELSIDKVPVLSWSPPIMLADTLIIISESGHVLGISPQDGRVIGLWQIDQGTQQIPIVVNQQLMVLTLDGQLIAYR